MSVDRDGRKLLRLEVRSASFNNLAVLPEVLAAVIRLMELTLIRVGNEEYAKTNKSFGLTTLRDRHARITTAGAADGPALAATTV